MLTKKHEFIREKDCCIIAGNGPSLESIDYTRLPREYDVFRCNQFYFEDKYFLGKKIKAYFAVPTIMFYQYYTIKQLVKANQYEIENIFCTTYGFLEEKQFIEKFPILFADAFNGMDILQLHKGIFSEIAQGYFYEHKLITSGVYMCVIAALLGYKELYLSGIDFYVGDKKYAFEATKSNIFQVAGDFGRLGSWHTQSHDLKILKFLESYGIKIYTLSAHSPLKEFFPIAKVSHADLSLSLSLQQVRLQRFVVEVMML